MKHLTPQQARAWRQAERQSRAARGEAAPLSVDVRREIESLHVGRPPGVENIPGYEHPDLTPDPVRLEHEQEAGDPHRWVRRACRSGKRTRNAGKPLEAEGFTEVAHEVHGFEGELNEDFQRSSRHGWRHEGLAWEQM